MLRLTTFFFVLSGSCLSVVTSAYAAPVTVPFTEDFSSNTSQWMSGASTALNYVSSGGPNGASDGYASTLFTEPSSTTAVVIFRGQSNFNSSNDAFVGDWVAAGVNEYSFWIRQNSSAALTVGTRFTTSANFPAFSALTETTIQPNVWTEVTFNISPTSPDLQPEGPTPFDSVFGSLASLQILAERGPLSAGTQVTFDLDKVSIVPEPSALLLAVAGVFPLGMLLRSRRRAASQG
ncbi:MAG TPA: hypothetical protein VGG64_16600 [Pirellulales bacterium]